MTKWKGNSAAVVITGIAALLGSCNKPAPSVVPQPAPEALVQKSGAVQIYAASYPLACLAERVGGHVVKVSWQPDQAQLNALPQADLLLVNHAVSPPRLTRSKILELTSEPEDAMVWNFDLCAQHAGSICDVLQKLKPDEIELFALNLDLVQTDLQSLAARMKQVSRRKLNGAHLVTSSSMLKPWAEIYGLHITFIDWDPNRIEDLKRALTEHPAKVFLSIKTPSGTEMEKLKTLGLKSVVLDDCGTPPASGDWLNVMNANVKAMESLAAEGLK